MISSSCVGWKVAFKKKNERQQVKGRENPGEVEGGPAMLTFDEQELREVKVGGLDSSRATCSGLMWFGTTG